MVVRGEMGFRNGKVTHREGRYNASAFYAQQSAEKAFKAVLYKLIESVRELESCW